MPASVYGDTATAQPPLIQGVSQSERFLSFQNSLSAIGICAFCSRETLHCSSKLSTIRSFSVCGIKIAL